MQPATRPELSVPICTSRTLGLVPVLAKQDRMGAMRGTMKVTQERRRDYTFRSLLPTNPEPLVCEEEMIVAPSLTLAGTICD